MAMTMPQELRLEPMVEDIQRLLKVGARMYMCMTRATLDRHGRDGEMPVRLGLRAYGHWRGTEMREAHHALGLDVNMRNLILCWDSASVFIVKDREDTAPDYKPYDTRFDVHLCPASTAWKEDDFHRWGHVYCDEFHQACASTYHPDGNVVIPENLMKGDDHSRSASKRDSRSQRRGLELRRGPCGASFSAVEPNSRQAPYRGRTSRPLWDGGPRLSRPPSRETLPTVLFGSRIARTGRILTSRGTRRMGTLVPRPYG